MSFNGSGTFVINSSGQPVVANTVISSTVFNALTADLATGLSTCITKDGQTTPTANIPMGTFKFTNLGVGSAATDSATLGQVQASTTKLVTVSGTDTITGTMTPALTAYASGQMFYFVAGGANTGAVTLNIDGLGARNVTRHGSVALVAGDILSGEVCVVVYDGTRFQLLNPASYTNLNVTGVLALAAGTALLPSLAFTGDLNTGLWSPAADTLAASTGGSERLRVDSSGNLGIGIAGPLYKLHVAQTSSAVVFGQDGTTPTVIGTNAAGTNSGALSLRGFPLTFTGNGAGGAEQMRLDTSGNLGIGLTNPTSRLELYGGAAGTATYATIGNATTAGLFGVGTGNDVQVRTAQAVPITFYTSGIERMRLDSSGNLGIGTTSPISGSGLTIGNDGNSSATVKLAYSTGSAERGSIQFAGSTAEMRLTAGFSGYGGLMTFYANGSERARIDSSGNLGIGTSSPAQRLDVTGAANSVQARFGNVAGRGLTIGTAVVSGTNDAGVVFNAPITEGALIFQTNSTERARIDGNGNIVAGASAALATTATNGFLYVPTCAGTPTGTPTAITGMAPIVVNTTNNKLYFYSGGAWRDAGP
jgi:hypothetical protein